MQITIRNLDIASDGGHGRIKILMDSHPYSYETSIFTLRAPHEEVQDRQTKHQLLELFFWCSASLSVFSTPN